MRYLRQILQVVMIVFLAAISSFGWQAGADPQQKAQSDPFQSAFRKEGEILTKGSNEIPTGKLKVKSYRLERVKLDRPWILDNGTEIKSALKLVVTGDALPLSSTYTIWVNDFALMAIPKHDTGEIVAVFFDGRNVLEDGAVLSLSMDGGPCAYAQGSESVLPEKLSVPVELRAAPPARTPKIQLHTAQRRDGAPVVIIAVSPAPFTLIGRNGTPGIQVGKKSFAASGMAGLMAADIPYQVFEKIPDNSQIFVTWDYCGPGGEFVGRLNKSTLDH